jgi:hypothetical protein
MTPHDVQERTDNLTNREGSNKGGQQQEQDPKRTGQSGDSGGRSQNQPNNQPNYEKQSKGGQFPQSGSSKP